MRRFVFTSLFCLLPTVFFGQALSTAARLEAMGLVDAGALDPSIAVRIVYATADNFVGEVLYDDLDRAWLLPEAAAKLLRAQRLLQERRPGCRLIVYDAARPMSVQRRMWQTAVRTGKQYYVANPARGGGLHNYGAAVDVSILDEGGEPLPMGTAYDHLGPEANTDREGELVATGKIAEAERQNRLLLRGVMREAGFRTVASEWWHFNHCLRAEAIARYPLIDF
jgi:D-alanyl-D-alanine dipeptidase